MRIYLTSCETGPGAWRHHEELLRSLWNLSGKHHVLVDTPEAADIIVIGNIRDEHWFRSLRNHPVINRFPTKCFTVSEAWQLFPLLRGVYVNAHKGLRFASRYRSGSYALYHPDFKNPFIEKDPGKAYASEKKYLAIFFGRDSHPSRAALFRQPWARKDILTVDTSDFNAFTHDNSGKEARQLTYLSALLEAKFSLCPRGSGAASIRLFESMKVGVAPVIISDDWIFPQGPNWDLFSIRVAEHDVECIEDILCQFEPKYREMGRHAQEAFEQYFSNSAYFDYFVDQIVQIKQTQRISEALFWRMRGLCVLWEKFKRRAKSFMIARGNSWAQRWKWNRRGPVVAPRA